MSPEYQAQQIIANAAFNQIIVDEARLAQEKATRDALGMLSMSLLIMNSNPELAQQITNAAVFVSMAPQIEVAAAAERHAVALQFETAARMFHGTNGDEGTAGNKQSTVRSRKSNLVNA